MHVVFCSAAADRQVRRLFVPEAACPVRQRHNGRFAVPDERIAYHVPASKAVAELANHLGNHFCHEGIVLDDED